MPAVSFTSTFAASNPRLIHAGLNVAKGFVTSGSSATVGGFGGIVAGTGTTITASDKVLLIALPANAVIVDGYIVGNIDADTGNAIFRVAAFGSSGTASSTLANTLTITATSQIRRFGAGYASMPLTVSASDDVPVVWFGIECTTACTNTVTLSIALVLYYTARGQC